jgi:hypothetical protein
MVKFFSILLFIAAPVLIRAQSVSPMVISSTGSFTSNANFSVSSTTGEMTMVKTFSSSSVILTQGFQQPNDAPIGILDLVKDNYGSFAVYPNPAVDNMWFGFQFPDKGRVTVSLYDVLGQKLSDVYTGNYESGKTTEGFAVSNLAAGSYYLSLNFTAEKDGKTYIVTKSFYVIN